MALLLCVRLSALFALLLLTFLFGTLPVIGLHFRKSRKNLHNRINDKQEKSSAVFSSNCYVQVLTQIGGGVLFYAVLVHMLPEIKGNYETYLKSNNSIFKTTANYNKSEDNELNTDIKRLPIVEITLCCGFFLVYLIEELMHSLFGSHSHHLNQSDKIIINEESKLISRKQTDSNFGTFGNGMNTSIPESSASQCSTCTHLHSDSLLTEINDTRHRNLSIASNSYCSEIEILNHVNADETPLFLRVFDGIVIILAFSVHSLFDGISIGIQTSVSEVWTMFIAIASHKLLIAFILSVELYEKCGNFLLMTFYMLLFSIMSPIGIFIVIIMEQSFTDSDGESSLAVILLSAISAGTILYIVFFELLQKDRVKNLSGIVQFISMASGFVLMFAVSFTFQH